MFSGALIEPKDIIGCEGTVNYLSHFHAKLLVPHGEEEEAEDLGAEKDEDTGYYYIPAGRNLMFLPFKKWIPTWCNVCDDSPCVDDCGCCLQCKKTEDEECVCEKCECGRCRSHCTCDEFVTAVTDDEQNQRTQGILTQDTNTCGICLCPFESAVALSCGHVVCADCSPKIRVDAESGSYSCPFCRKTIEHRIKLFIEFKKEEAPSPSGGQKRKKDDTS